MDVSFHCDSCNEELDVKYDTQYRPPYDVKLDELHGCVGDFGTVIAKIRYGEIKRVTEDVYMLVDSDTR